MALRYRQPAKRPRPPRARLYQAHNDPTRRIAQAHEPRARRAFSGALKALRRSLPKAEIAALIRSRDLAGATDKVNLASFAHDLRPAFAILHEAFKASAENGAREIRALKGRRVRKDVATLGGDPQSPDRFAFDLLSDKTTAMLAEYQDALIGNLSDDVRTEIFDIITAGVAANLDADDIAISIRDEIGLSDRLATAVRNYRSALENLDATSLTRTLRDETSDDMIAAAIEAGTPLAEDLIDDLVNAYSERALDYRADMIAQTESNRAANMGLQEAYKQAISDGVFPAEAVKQYWMLALDERVCDECQGIAEDNEDGVPVGEAFSSEDEDIDAPPVHPNCRCTIEMRVDLDMVDAVNSGPGSEPDDSTNSGPDDGGL